MKKVAIFVDWENLRKEIESIQNIHSKCLNFNYNNVTDVSRLLKCPIDESKEVLVLYRIFFYTAEPVSFEIKLQKANKSMKNKINKFKQSNIQKYEKMENLRKKIISFIKEISFEDYFALRLGEARLQNFDKDNNPIISQKKVDMLLGLDISHLAYNKLVDQIIVFCKDTDIVPALKCARTNGLNVSLVHLKNGWKMPNSLKKHTDTIIEIDFVDKFKKIT